MTASSLFEIKELGRGGLCLFLQYILENLKDENMNIQDYKSVVIHDTHAIGKLHFIGLIILYFSAKYQLWMIDSLMEILLLGHGEMVDLNLW